MYENLLKDINSFDKITIFRHARPDGDAIFSQNALARFIKDNFKNKKVKCVGSDVYDIFPKVEKVSDDFIKDSLAIIVDCSNEDRTDDNRYKLAKKVVIIDHHPGKKPKHADELILNFKAAATCELLADIFYSKTFEKYTISKTVCKYLYCGILTDTIGFKTVSTTNNTLDVANKIVRDGKLKVSELNDYVFNINYSAYKKITLFRNYLKVKNNVGYVILDQKDLDEINMKFTDAKNAIDEFSSINDLKIWAVIAYNKNVGMYDGSIRSRRKYIINDLCTKYNGGGHKNACGVKKLTKKTSMMLINDLIDLASNY